MVDLKNEASVEVPSFQWLAGSGLVVAKKTLRFIEVYVEIDISKQSPVGLMGSFASFKSYCIKHDICFIDDGTYLGKIKQDMLSGHMVFVDFTALFS